jgi:excinuclease ABC subunit C
MNQEAFREIQGTIPSEPGIYRYYDDSDTLLYVGKAKNLRKRVSSYFTRTGHSNKTRELVRKIVRIEFTFVDTEQDAFLLENALIKEFKPKYNIDLKDDKTYPFIVIKNEPFPRVFLTRKLVRDGSEYLGPFTSVARVRELLQFTRQHIPLRTCTLNLTAQNIARQKFKVCLEYHLGNCKGPCAGLQTEADYAEGLQQLKSLLKGNLNPVLQHYRAEMKKLVEDMAFEKAEIIRKKIEHLRHYQSSSAIVSQKMGDVDVFTIAREGNEAYVNYLMVRNGTVTDTQTIILQCKLEETEEELLAYGISHMRDTFGSTAPEIILPFRVSFLDETIRQTVPKGGDKKKLMDLSGLNVRYFIAERERKKRLHLGSEEQDMQEILLQLQDDLSLQDLPVHIECFDNSNFQGSYPVSAMVCFRNGKPSKSDYRHYNVKGIEGINDFATMKQVVFRRYRKLLDLHTPLPQLVIIDGGKGQLGAALESIEALGLSGSMTMVGLAKNEEEIFFPGDKESLKLPYGSASLKLIRRIRDEVHRIGISFHRNKRSKATFSNSLEQIKGIGRQTADQLLKKFRSVKNIQALTKEEIAAVTGKSKAAIIYRHFHPVGGDSGQVSADHPGNNI